jgi:broad specificity phosphatase PhoE
MKSNIFLVRHAQSQSNIDEQILKEQTNVGIHLTDTGIQQAKEVGDFIVSNYYSHLKPLKIWNSPYNRTRQTANEIKKQLKNNKIHYIEEESIYIIERQFGLIDDAINYQKSHPVEYSHYLLHNKENKEFFVRPPLGESPFDMCMRLDFLLRCVISQEPEYQHIIVSHGAAIRGLVIMQEKLPYEDYFKIPNPSNASIHHLDANNGYKGKIFEPAQISY